jgi:exonuclease III
MSYNLQGLTSRNRRVRFRTFLRDLDCIPDVLCIQEHKIRVSQLGILKKEIWNSALFISAPAADGVHAQRNDGVIGGKGGVSLAVGSRISPFVSASGVLPCPRAVWVHINHPRWGALGVMGIYAPNSATSRMKLWKDMFDVTDNSRQWILMGDFNMIEARGDQRGGGMSLIAGGEKNSWRHLKRRLNLTDSFALCTNAVRNSEWSKIEASRQNLFGSTAERYTVLRKILDSPRIWSL